MIGTGLRMRIDYRPLLRLSHGQHQNQRGRDRGAGHTPFDQFAARQHPVARFERLPRRDRIRQRRLLVDRHDDAVRQ
ncbi:hypothetical protein D3C72_1843740 [compost metagenome]